MCTRAQIYVSERIRMFLVCSDARNLARSNKLSLLRIPDSLALQPHRGGIYAGGGSDVMKGHEDTPSDLGK